MVVLLEVESILFQWLIDDVRVYNRPMSSEEVSKLYNYEKEDSFKDGLVAHYPFNGNANDASGNGKNATVHGPTLTKDRFEQSKAYSFDGSNDYISAPNNLKNFGIQNQFTLSSWFWLKTMDQLQNAYGRWY